MSNPPTPNQIQKPPPATWGYFLHIPWITPATYVEKTLAFPLGSKRTYSETHLHSMTVCVSGK